MLSNVCADARPATREKIANSPETRAFLEIGLLLLHDDLLDHRGPDLLADHDAGTRLFAGLSQARLIERAEQEDRGAGTSEAADGRDVPGPLEIQEPLHRRPDRLPHAPGAAGRGSSA